jgi:hypothetical protein
VTSQARTIVGGAVYGTCAAALVGFGVVRLFIQTSGSSLDALVWGAGFSVPWGPLAGAAGGWFLYWRARHVESIGRLVCETSLLGAAVTTGIGQMLLPIAWQLLRGFDFSEHLPCPLRHAPRSGVERVSQEWMIARIVRWPSTP